MKSQSDCLHSYKSTKYFNLWEKEIRNPEEEKLITEATEREDFEKLQNHLQLQKKNLRSNENKKGQR